MPLLSIKLRKLPSVLGIYGKTGDYFPPAASYLHPEAAEAFERACAQFVRLRVSDMFRTPEQSMQARAEKAGVQPPGYSAHNFGFAIDVDVEKLLKQTGLSKDKFDAKMMEFHWYCHRRDGKRGFEDWHFNYLGPDAAQWLAKASKTSTAGAIEAKIAATYAEGLKLDPPEIQECLKQMKMYSGDIDGQIGPRSKAALAAFQRTWALPDTGVLDPKTERTLAYVSCVREEC